MIVAGTGHRPPKLGGYGPGPARVLEDLAREAITRLGAAEVISGMALGWDQALARAAVSLGVPFVAAVPFEGQESKWPDKAKKEFARVLALASCVVVVCPGGYAPWKMQHRNEWMVNHCDVVAALWDGTSGGTANCVGYAKMVGKPVHNFWSEYQWPISRT